MKASFLLLFFAAFMLLAGCVQAPPKDNESPPSPPETKTNPSSSGIKYPKASLPSEVAGEGLPETGSNENDLPPPPPA
ncbi:MAG: hypothetical protein QXN37_03220 [Candidatus Anstonellaceae archaeon]